MTWDDLLAPARLFDATPDEILTRRRGEPVPMTVAFGGGLNSTAALVLLHRLGDRPDAVLFADTGHGDAEKPETYAHVAAISGWCESVGFPPVVTVRRNTDPGRQVHEEKYDSLEGECRVKRCLPSIAYYGRSCSEKWKQQPQAAWLNNWPAAQARWRAGGRVVKVIGYDADESYRAKRSADGKYSFWHPLIDYGWGRDECQAALLLAGLPVPPKSSCFFCPEMTVSEVLDLRANHPDLFARALAMESRAELRGIKGLGKHEYSWAELARAADGRLPLPVSGRPRLPCVCNDGGESWA